MPNVPHSLLLVSALLALLGCTPPGTHPVQLTGVTGLLDGQPVHIVLGPIEGPEGSSFRKDLRETLLQLPGVAVQEHPGSLPAPPRSCLLTGRFLVEAKEEAFTRGTGADEKAVVATTVTTDFDFRIQDLATGLPLIEDTLREEDRDEVERPKDEPRKKLGQRMLEGTLGFIARTTLDILLGWKPVTDAQRAEVLKRHRRELGLRKETWKFLLCSETGLPGLQPGIEAARANDWRRAAGRFQQVVDANPRHSGLHKAHYDLGIACLALERFDEARAQLLQARALLQGSGHGLSLKERSADMERTEAALEHGLRLDRMRRWRNGEALAEP